MKFEKTYVSTKSRRLLRLVVIVDPSSSMIILTSVCNLGKFYGKSLLSLSLSEFFGAKSNLKFERI